MIFRESLLRVADNSGARLVRCVGLAPPFAREGDLLTVSVVRCRPRSRVGRGQLYRALLVQCRRPSVRWGGVRVGFRSNRVVLLRRADSARAEPLPLGTRLLRPLSLAVRRRGFAKLLLLAPALLLAMPTGFIRLWLEDTLLRFPSGGLVPFPPPISFGLRQPAGFSPVPAWELLCWLAGGRPPLLRFRGRWLEFSRPSAPLPPLLWRLLAGWLPRLLRRDLSPLVRISGDRWVVVIRDWGELGLPLDRDYYDFRLPLRLELAGGGRLLASLFRLRLPLP